MKTTQQPTVPHGMRNYSKIFERSRAHAAALVSKFKGESPHAELLEAIDGHKATIRLLESEVAQLKAENAEIEKLRTTVKQLQSHSISLSQTTIDQVAALGFPMASLPASTSADQRCGDGDDEPPLSPADFIRRHATLVEKDPEKAGAFYTKYAKRFGYESK